MNKADTIVSDSAGTHASPVCDDENDSVLITIKTFKKKREMKQ